MAVIVEPQKDDARSKDVKRTSLAADIRDLRLIVLILFTFAVWLTFHFVFTDGFILTTRNLSTLSVQMTVTAILTIGMTQLLIAREIDLSAGAVMALIMVLIFQFQSKAGLSTPLTIFLALATGAAIGLLHGIIRVTLLIPSFIITLAGFSWIRGVSFIVPDGQTLSGASDSFYNLSNGNIPPLPSAIILLGLGGIALIGCVRSSGRSREKLPITQLIELTQIIAIVIFAVGGAYVFYTHRGLPYPTFLLGFLIILFHWLSRNTSFGRHMYAIGGNTEAAKRVGINVPRSIVILFVLMGVLTAVAAVVQGSLLDAAPPGIGELLALNAISAAIIGGTNLFGGHGSIFGSVAGALLMASISNGLSLAGVNTFYQMVATGVILVFAVGLDALTHRRGTWA